MTDQERIATLEGVVADLKAEVSHLSACMVSYEDTLEKMGWRVDDLFVRMHNTRRLGAMQADVEAVAARVAVLENPETPLERGHRGLEEATAARPEYAEHLTQAEVKARKDAAGEKD